jgi:membrane protein
VKPIIDRIEEQPAVRFWKRFSNADPGVLAAAVAYNLFFALVPVAAVLLIVASLFGQDAHATEKALTGVLPPDMARTVAQVLNGVAVVLPDRKGVFIVVGLIVAGWSASRGVLTLIRVVRQIEGLEDDRPWWKVRLVAIALTVGGAIAFALTMALIPIGGVIADRLEQTTGIGGIHTLWNSLRIPIAAVGILLFLWLFYRFGPPRRLPGIGLASTVGAGGIVGFSLAFQAFIDWRGGAPGATFAVFTLAVLLLWLYVIAYVIIISASLSAAVARRYSVRRKGAE